MMLKESSKKDSIGTHRGGNIVPALCSVLGVLLLMVAFGLAIAFVAPSIQGYSVHDVSGTSGDASIPAGSTIYVSPTNLEGIAAGDVIAFDDDGCVSVDRVAVNRTMAREVLLAQSDGDLDAIPYKAIIGCVKAHVPFVGALGAVCSSTMGIVYLVLTMACGVLLLMIARTTRASQRRAVMDEYERARSRGRHAASASSVSQRRRMSTPRKVAIAVFAVLFVGSTSVVVYTNWQYAKSDSLYSETADQFTQVADADADATASASSERTKSRAPIVVDFNSLRAQNSDIVGWIYCAGTPINYPVLHGSTNDQYLYSDYTGAYSINGSIFVDAGNSAGFSDAQTIIYGHNMNTSSMFASLLYWADQAFYEAHPVIWLFTPTQNYKIVLFSGHHVKADSYMYSIIKRQGDELDALVADAIALSDFKARAEVKLDPNARYVMLSTCTYLFENGQYVLFDNDRYVLHGMLVPDE